MRISACGWRLGGIFAPIAVDMVHGLGLGVIRLKFVIRNRPGGGYASVVPEFAEVFFPKTKQGSAVELRVPTNVVVCVRMQRTPVLVVPDFLRLILALEVD